MDKCLAYSAYATSNTEEEVEEILKSIQRTLIERTKKGIVFQKYSDSSYILEGIPKEEAARFNLVASSKPNSWLVPMYKVPAVRYYAATGIITKIEGIDVDDKRFFDSLLNKMAKMGLLYESLKPIDRKVFEETFLQIPDKTIPTPTTYLSLRSYIDSKRTESHFFPPRVYTEILELAGRVKKEDGVLIHDYNKSFGGMIVLVGCKGIRLTKAKAIIKSALYPNMVLEDYIGYDTTIVRYHQSID